MEKPKRKPWRTKPQILNKHSLRDMMPVVVQATDHKAKALLEVDVSDAAVPLEEPLHILLPGGGAQPADEDATPAHGARFSPVPSVKKKKRKIEKNKQTKKNTGRDSAHPDLPDRHHGDLYMEPGLGPEHVFNLSRSPRVVQTVDLHTTTTPLIPILTGGFYRCTSLTFPGHGGSLDPAEEESASHVTRPPVTAAGGGGVWSVKDRALTQLRRRRLFTSQTKTGPNSSVLSSSGQQVAPQPSADSSLLLCLQDHLSYGNCARTKSTQPN